MDYGFNIPMRGPTATAEGVIALAQRGEALGFSYLAVPDHIVIPKSIESRYPYSPGGEFPGGAGGDSLEQLASMAFLAAVTSKPRLLASVMVVPHRSPVYTAKVLASLDVLSNGRVTVGCGAGWLAEEFAAIGAPPFAERGKVTDEYLAIFRQLWTEDAPQFAGEYARYNDISFLPKPLQQPHPPLWIGGESGPALRRAARVGNAWYPIGANPRHPLNTLELYRSAIGRLAREAEQLDRDPAEIALVYWANWYYEGRLVTLDNGERHLFTGSDAQVADDISALRELGVSTLLFNFQRPALNQSLTAMERFVAEVLPLAER